MWASIGLVAEATFLRFDQNSGKTVADKKVDFTLDWVVGQELKKYNEIQFEDYFLYL